MGVFLFVGLIFFGICYGEKTTSPHISVNLRAHWKETPLLLEASEYVAEVDEKLFWKFLWQAKDTDQKTDKDNYDAILLIAQSLLATPTYHLLSFSLALHTHSPKVQMFQQVSLEALQLYSVPTNCTSAVVFQDIVSCTVEELEASLENLSSNHSPVTVYSFDHCYPFSSSLPTAILYGEMGTKQFGSLFQVLWTRIEAGQLRACVRHWVKERSNRLRLSGYGVQLAIKNTEYKAVDDTKVEEGTTSGQSKPVEDDSSQDINGFNFKILKERYKDLSTQLDEFRQYLLDKSKELPVLKAWEISDLGIQAAQQTLESEFSLQTLQNIAHNLPVLAKSLSRTSVSKELRIEIESNQIVLRQVGLSPGDSILLLNGIVIQEDEMEIFGLLDYLKKEAHLLAGLEGLGIPRGYHSNLLSLQVHPQHTSFAIDIRSDSVLFINDIEKDKLYSRWSTSVTEFLRPTFPGTLRQIRKNAFNIVFIMDPLTFQGAEFLQYISLFLSHATPFRLGTLLVSSGCGLNEEKAETKLSQQFIAIFNYLADKYSPNAALAWSSSMLEDINNPLNISWTTLIDGLNTEFSLSSSDVNDIVKSDSKYSVAVESACEFYLSRGFSNLPQVLVNGVQLEIEDNDLENAIVTEVQRQTSEIQQQVFMKRITDHTNFYEYFMKKSNVLERLNKYVINLDSKKVDLSGVWPGVELSVELLTDQQLAAAVTNEMTYLFAPEGEFITKALTLWVIADLTTPSGRQLARSALEFTLSKESVRVGFLSNPPSSFLSIITSAIVQSQRLKVAIEVIKQLLQEDTNEWVELVDVVKKTEKINIAAFESKINELLSKSYNYQKEFIKKVLQLEEGQQAILSNGRLIGPFLESDKFVLPDFGVLLQFEMSSHAKAVLDEIESLELIFSDPDDDTADYRSNLVMKIASLLRSVRKSRRIALPTLQYKHSVLFIPPLSNLSGPIVEFMVVLNPLSRAAQRLVPLLSSLIQTLPLNLTVVMNPFTKLSETPIKDFYRSVLNPSLSFHDNGSLASSGSSAIFTSLPLSPLLTLNMDVPHSWMVQSIYSPYDLDNIHLAAVEREVYAEFELEYILVEGQCFDGRTNSPTPGLQFVMGTDRQPDLYDTIVMANLGYFQLKGRPGAWKIRLREGKSADIYHVTSYYQTGGYEVSSANISTIPVTVTSFTSTALVVEVEKKPGMEKVSLLQDDDSTPTVQDDNEAAPDGIFDTITKLFSDSSKEETDKKNEVDENETINIFSIASGHLYERLQRIMMLSVMKHTKSPVKFWFLKNFISHNFMNFIPKLAEKYGFQYELVQYKWPRWLHAQTEKQRIIWGYKILFLDVLFPLNIKKIIFVDADQIVRVDMKELLEVPLDGAPYGYTPFCDSRTEMEGFRFWKKGYWKSHLGKRRYHISALYVVDLQRFRQLAAGDRLRGQYQMLSQDPNSLSNLDQDLPNNMIHNVPIKSLPQDWLWCETWCSDESKSRAKTIDLCNNPLTKESKLTSAVRIVKEWKDYDNEIKQLQEETDDDKGHTHSVHQEL